MAYARSARKKGRRNSKRKRGAAMAYQKAATIHTTLDSGVTIFTWKKEPKNAAQTELDLVTCKPVAPTLEAFYGAADAVLAHMPETFWFSEFRTRVPLHPPNPSAHWGQYTRRMKRYGYYQTHERRKSGLDSRRGGEEAKWCRAKYNNAKN